MDRRLSAVKVYCDNITLADPYYLNLLNHSWPSNRLVVSLITGKEYLTFLNGHTKQNIHNWDVGRKENKQTRTWVSSKRKKGEVCSTFLAFCELSWAYIRAKFPQSHQERWLIHSRWPTRPLDPHILAVGFPWLLLTALSCRLLCSVHFSVLPPSLFCSGTFLLSSSSGLVGDLGRKPFLWDSCENRQRDPLDDTYPHPHNESPTSCLQKYSSKARSEISQSNAV